MNYEIPSLIKKKNVRTNKYITSRLTNIKKQVKALKIVVAVSITNDVSAIDDACTGKADGKFA